MVANNFDYADQDQYKEWADSKAIHEISWKSHRFQNFHLVRSSTWVEGNTQSSGSGCVVTNLAGFHQLPAANHHWRARVGHQIRQRTLSRHCTAVKQESATVLQV